MPMFNYPRFHDLGTMFCDLFGCPHDETSPAATQPYGVHVGDGKEREEVQMALLGRSYVLGPLLT